MAVEYSVVAIYFTILFVIGFFASKRVKGSDDFYIGGKKLGYWVASFSALATGQSAWLFLGLSGFGAIFGASAYWVMIGEVICIAFLWFKMGEKIKTFSDKHNSITIPDFLQSRFNSQTHTLRIITATVLSLFVMVYISSQIDATGSAFESFLGWNYFLGAAIGFGIVVLYCFGGGYVAACWTDLFQGIVMFLALVLLPICVIISMDGSLSDLYNELNAVDPHFLTLWGSGGPSVANLMIILGFLLIGLGHLGSPQISIRFVSIRSIEEIKKGRWIAIIFTLGTEFAAISSGILARYIFTDSGSNPEAILGNGGQNSVAMLVEKFFPPVIVGIYIAAVLSAIMSTVSSLLVLASSAITRDFYQRILHPNKSERDLILISRIVTLSLAIIAFSVSIMVAILSPERTIFWFVIFGWSGIAAAFCPMMLLSIFWKGYNEKGAIASITAGFLSVPFFKFIAPSFPIVGELLDKLSALPPAFAISLIAGYMVSRLANKKIATN